MFSGALHFEKFSLLSAVILCLTSLVLAQSSSSASSAASGSASNSGSVSSGSLSASATSANASSSVTASSTATADLPSLSGYSGCVVLCFETAIAKSGCDSVVPESCYCTSSNFTSSLISCMHDSCPTDLSTAEGLSNKFCALASTSTSLSFSVTSFSSSSSSSSASLSGSGSSASATSPSSASSTNSPTNSSNAAAGVIYGSVSQATLMSIGVALFGVLAGALLVE